MSLVTILCLTAFAAAPPPAGRGPADVQGHPLPDAQPRRPARSRAYVLVFTTTSCPLVEPYLPGVDRMEKAYRGKGVQFVAVNVGADDTIAAMAAHAVEHGVAFPCVKDMSGACAATLG